MYLKSRKECLSLAFVAKSYPVLCVMHYQVIHYYNLIISLFETVK